MLQQNRSMLTQEELQQIGQLFDAAFDKKVKPLKVSILASVRRTIRREFNITNGYFDRITTNHENRLKRIEKNLEIPSSFE
jgi:hypothetical protein